MKKAIKRPQKTIKMVEKTMKRQWKTTRLHKAIIGQRRDKQQKLKD